MLAVTKIVVAMLLVVAGSDTAAEPAVPLAAAAGPALSCALENSRSMHFADLALLPFLLRAANTSTGHFVEIGALDGVSLSNTLMLERCFGWSGLLIEGSPTNFAEIRRNGRRATSVHSAVCDQVGFVEFAYSGKGERGAINRQVGLGKPAKGVTSEIARVPCKPLGQLMDEARLPEVVEFLSLDVEGAEWQVIRTVDPARFKVIIVEMPAAEGTKNLTEAHHRIHDRIMAAGLHWARYYPDHGNRVYMHRDLAINKCGRRCWRRGVSARAG